MLTVDPKTLCTLTPTVPAVKEEFIAIVPLVIIFPAVNVYVDVIVPNDVIPFP